MVLKLELESESPGGLFKLQIWAPPTVSDFVGLVWDPKICISKKLPGGTYIAGRDFILGASGL